MTKWKEKQDARFARAVLPPSQRYIREEMKKALDPTQAPKPVVSLKDMSPEKRAEMLRLYSKP